MRAQAGAWARGERGEACTVPPSPAYSRTVPAPPPSLSNRPLRRHGNTRRETPALRDTTPDVTVTEEQIATAILRIVELEKGVVEGAAATPLAACLSGKLEEFAGKKCVLLLCGGNIDPNMLSRVIERGLVADGRLGSRTWRRRLPRPGPASSRSCMTALLPAAMFPRSRCSAPSKRGIANISRKSVRN